MSIFYIRRAAVLFLGLLFITCGVSCKQVEPEMLDLAGDLSVHDPVMIKEGDTYYVFSTGGGRRSGIIPIRSSEDMYNWKRCGSVFEQLPEWCVQEIPGTRGAWAPDISYFNGKFHLYYSVSTFGKNNSAIGLVTNKTLDPESPAYKWEDHGMVLRSTAGEDDWNAIDANLVIEDEEKLWLSWGSFWSGIKMKRIDPVTGKLSAEDTNLYSLSGRPREESHRTPPVEGAVEAPFIVKHGDYWYLFVSFDFCCRGANSTYNVVVGRSKTITGPYVDRDGRPMIEGGGTQVIKATGENWKGPGHNGIYMEPDSDFLVFHAYDGKTGRSELKISTMTWPDGWPKVAELE